MTNKIPSVTRKHCKTTKGESHQMPKIGLFLHLLRLVSSFTTSKSHKTPEAAHSTTVVSFATLF